MANTKSSGPVPNLDVSFRVDRSDTDTSRMPTKPAAPSHMRSITYDRWLIARFLICFGLSNVLWICLILYYMFLFDRNADLAREGGPDYSLHHTLDDIGLSMPGVSSGLLIFIVFGTTAPFRREYRKWLQPCRRRIQGRHGPIMVAPLDSVNAGSDEALTGQGVSFEQDASRTVEDSGRRFSSSSAWELPPMDFDEFSEKEIIPRSSLE
jgi:hypothetical protein